MTDCKVCKGCVVSVSYILNWWILSLGLQGTKKYVIYEEGGIGSCTELNTSNVTFLWSHFGHLIYDLY